MSLEWRQTAACLGRLDVMFMEDSHSGAPRRAALVAARTLCESCPHTGLDGPCVKAWHELDDNCDRRVGVWGGFTGVELGGKFSLARRLPDRRGDMLDLFNVSPYWTLATATERRGITEPAAAASFRVCVSDGLLVVWGIPGARGAVWSLPGAARPPVEVFPKSAVRDVLFELRANRSATRTEIAALVFGMERNGVRLVNSAVRRAKEHGLIEGAGRLRLTGLGRSIVDAPGRV